MLIYPDHLEHWIDHFYGYGSWEAPMWFVAREESGGDTPEEVAGKLNYFHHAHAQATGPTLCDIRALYRTLQWGTNTSPARFGTRYDYRFGDDAVKNSVWKNLVDFEHGFLNQPPPDATGYQKETFASPHSAREALIRLLPLPSPHNHAWYYSWLDMPGFPFLRSRAQYEAHIGEKRITTLLERLREYSPSVVLMYGMQQINTLRQSVQGFFPGVRFTMVKAVKRQTPQYHIADIHGTVLVVTTQVPALRHNRIETGFDWRAFGEMLGRRVR